MWILKKAASEATCQPLGTVAASNGLGAITVNTDNEETIRAVSRSSKLIRVETGSGYIEQTFSMSATATAMGQGPTYYNTAATQCSFEIEFKNTGVSTSVGSTFVLGEGGTRFAAPKGETHTVGREYTFPGPSGGYKEWGLYVTYYRALIGPWFDPYHEWNDGTTFWSDSWLSEYDQVETSYKYGLNVVTGIPAGGPKMVTMNLKVKDVDPDEDHTVIPKKHKLFIYAPVMNPTHVATEAGFHYNGVSLSTTGNSPAYAGAGIGCTWDERAAVWDFFEHLGDVTDTASLFTRIPWLGGVCAVLGLTEAMFGPESKSQTAPWAWGSAYPDSTYNGDPTAPTSPMPGCTGLYDGWEMWPNLERAYKTKWVEANIYDESGYKLTRQDTYEHIVDGHYKWWGDFDYVDPNGGPGL